MITDWEVQQARLSKLLNIVLLAFLLLFMIFTYKLSQTRVCLSSEVVNKAMQNNSLQRVPPLPQVIKINLLAVANHCIHLMANSDNKKARKVLSDINLSNKIKSIISLYEKTYNVHVFQSKFAEGDATDITNYVIDQLDKDIK
jgi:hypothetical protein